MHLPGIILLMAAALGSAHAAADGRPAPLLPPVEEVQRQAVASAHIDVAEADSWKQRARVAAFVPRLQLEYGRRMRNVVDVDVNENVYVGASGVVVGPEDGKYSCNQTADNSFGVRAIWELRDAVFNRDVLAASAERRNIARERNALLAEVNKRYYVVASTPAEVRLLAELVPAAPRREKALHDLFLRTVACEESVAGLDALTGGWFKEQLKGPVCDAAGIPGREAIR